MSERILEVREVRTGFRNGVQTICTQDVYDMYTKQQEIIRAIEKLYISDPDLCTRAIKAARGAMPAASPIFTFAEAERVSQSPWFTGTHEDCRSLLTHLGKFFELRMHDGLFVPFSSGSELGQHGLEALGSEYAFVTSPQQFRETWGISLKELRECYPNPPRT
ncbi:MAG: hypothetical protein AAB733_01865 [Patescibacteria group bacterium]